MARVEAVLNASLLVIACFACATSGGFGFFDNNDSQNYEALMARLSELEQEVAAQRAKLMQFEQLVKIKEVNTGSQVIGALDRQCCTIDSMPSSCLDLSRIGHTFSGFYMLKGSKSIQVAYCDFTKLENSSNYQVLIGNSDVKTSSVYFYFQKSPSNFATERVPVPFEIERVNIGNGMRKTGIFTAPRTGRYSFSLHGVASFAVNKVKSVRARFYINLYLNGKPMNAGAYADTMTHAIEKQFDTFSLQNTVDLNAGDKVWLQAQIRTPGASLWEDTDFTTHFTGWLVEEDLSSVLKLK